MLLGHDYPGKLQQYADTLSRFGEGRSVGDRWYARCPAHPDNTPSLAFWVGSDGRLMFGCWANCPKVAVMKAAALEWKDFFPTPEGMRPARKMVAEYDYRDEAGAVLYQAVRYEPKDFRQRRPMPGGGWAWTLKGGAFRRKDERTWVTLPVGETLASTDVRLDDCRRVLYRLPELLAADPKEPVLVVEGEKDVHTAVRLGFVATTNAGGSRADWLDEYSEALSGRHVRVIADDDQNGAGRKHAREVFGSVAEFDPLSVRVTCLPAKDLTAFVEALSYAGVCDVWDQRAKVVEVLKESKLWRVR